MGRTNKIIVRSHNQTLRYCGSPKTWKQPQKQTSSISRLQPTAFVSRKVVSKLSCVCLHLGKLVNGKHFPVNGKHFPVKEKLGLVSRKVFILDGKHFLEVVKNLEMSYYLSIISNLVLKLLIAIYIYIYIYIFCFEYLFFNFIP